MDAVKLRAMSADPTKGLGELQWACEEAADALEAQAKRIAELEAALRGEHKDGLSAAWAVWRKAHPHLSLGPGPGFQEAIAAYLGKAIS